jgi:serine/threonine protein kinase
MKCLFALGTAESDSVATESADQSAIRNLKSAIGSRSFGDYELLEDIARGGIGIVYKAQQKSLGRVVALKLLLFGSQSSKEQAQRFRAEAATAATLQHPNIVAIHEVSAHEGQPFFVMDFIEGQNLARLTAECEVRNAEWLRRAARYVKIVAEAIHYAHERGILYRDLKPSNVLIDAFDQPRVTDFGLAKRLHHDSELTLSGQVLGSPNYMPPEQAAAKRGLVGRRSDVYSLGAILYHLLTGRPPFVGETLTDTLQEVVNTEPVSPRLLNPGVPRDLETLCLKCLEKEPARRYQTAQALANDLDRFLHDEPIQARPVNTAEKFSRWCGRKPALAASFFSISILLLIVIIGSPIAVFRINRERSKAEHLLYVSTMNVAQAAWEENNAGRLRQLLEETQNSPDRGFEWYYWQRQTHLPLMTLRGHFGAVISVAFSPDAQRIVTGSVDQTAKVWDAVSGRELLTLKGHSGGIKSVAFSPDGQRIITSGYDGTAKIWEMARAEKVAARQVEEQAAEQTLAGLRRDRIAEQERERIALASDEGRIKRWLIFAPIALRAGQSGAEGLDIDQMEGEAQLQPIAAEARSTGGSKLRWRELTLEDDADYTIDFNAILGRETTQSVAYAVCYIRSETEQLGLRMLVGSDDQAKVYLNGKQLYRSPVARPFLADQDSVPDITLNAGLNVLVFKVVNETIAWHGSIRFTDAQGNPVKGIKVTLTP